MFFPHLLALIHCHLEKVYFSNWYCCYTV